MIFGAIVAMAMSVEVEKSHAEVGSAASLCSIFVPDFDRLSSPFPPLDYLVHKQKPYQDMVHDRLNLSVDQQARIVSGSGSFVEEVMAVTSPMKDRFVRRVE